MFSGEIHFLRGLLTVLEVLFPVHMASMDVLGLPYVTQTQTRIEVVPLAEMQPAIGATSVVPLAGMQPAIGAISVVEAPCHSVLM